MWIPFLSCCASFSVISILNSGNVWTSQRARCYFLELFYLQGISSCACYRQYQEYTLQERGEYRTCVLSLPQVQRGQFGYKSMYYLLARLTRHTIGKAPPTSTNTKPSAMPMHICKGTHTQFHTIHNNRVRSQVWPGIVQIASVRSECLHGYDAISTCGHLLLSAYVSKNVVAPLPTNYDLHVMINIILLLMNVLLCDYDVFYVLTGQSVRVRGR